MFRLAARLWIVVFAVVLALGALAFSSARIHTDIRALLPGAQEETVGAAQILAHAAEISRDVWVLVGLPSGEEAERAARLMQEAAARRGLSLASPADTFDAGSLARALTPWRDAFLTAEDKAFLEKADDKALLHRALSLLYRPLSIGVLPFEDDPLGTFQNALLSRAGDSPLDFTRGCAALKERVDGLSWCALTARPAEAMAVSGEMPATHALLEARAAVLEAFPQARVHASGVPLISERTASGASHEAALIGSVSAVGITALVLLFFASLRPLIVTLAALAASLTFACAVTLAVFGEVHMLTLVFGATLLGICVDYVFHLLCAASGGLTGPEARDRLFKPLTVSLLTTIAGYAVMAASPMPGLRQMAVFCMAGLAAAYLTVILIVPRFVRPAAGGRASLLPARTLGALPILAGRARVFFIVLVLAISAAGALNLKTQNELALLNRIPPELLVDMQFVGKALSPVSAGQVFVITGPDTETVLRTARSLRDGLNALAVKGIVGRAPDPAALLPSQAEQDAVRPLSGKARARALELVSETLGQDFAAGSAVAREPLTPSVLSQAAPGTVSNFRLSDTALLVPLAGVTPESLPQLQKLAEAFDGVRFVNTTAEVAESLAHYRDGVFAALAAVLAAIGVLLALVLRRKSLSVWLPTVLSVALTLGASGFLDVPFSLFTVLPLVLVVGLGVDYAVVLYSKENTAAAASSVFLAASSTLLAFGLLAFSSTPALHLFGLTLTLAMAAVLVTTVLLRPARQQKTPGISHRGPAGADGAL